MGIDPDHDLYERTHLRFDRLFAIGSRENIPTLGAAPMPLLSHSAPGTGGTQAENKPTQLVGDRKFASDPCITGTLET